MVDLSRLAFKYQLKARVVGHQQVGRGSIRGDTAWAPTLAALWIFSPGLGSDASLISPFPRRQLTHLLQSDGEGIIVRPWLLVESGHPGNGDDASPEARLVRKPVTKICNFKWCCALH